MKYNIVVIGAGNGGHAIAGHFGLMGHRVTLYNITLEHLDSIRRDGGIHLCGAITGFGKVHRLTDNIEEALNGNEIIMIVTTANAHAEIARMIAPYLKDGQIIVLNPGRTGGALEVRHVFKQLKMNKRVYIAEAQSLIYACRIKEPGIVNIIGVKDKVFLSALPHEDSGIVVSRLNDIFSCFVEVDNVMITSLENIGAIFHPSIVLFNAATIERGQGFYFYQEMTEQVGKFLVKLDQERLDIGSAFNLELISAFDWISYAYHDIKGDDLWSRMRNNPAYDKIRAPQVLNSRLLFEDIPTGILPMIEFARLAGIDVPLMQSVFSVGQALLEVDFIEKGRTLKNLGLEDKIISDIFSSL